MRIAWITDPHFDDPDVAASTFAALKRANPDAILLTGDVAIAATFTRWLERLAREIGSPPVYFVLGNHDCYGDWIPMAQQAAAHLASRNPRLRYLTAETAPIELAPGVALVGHDGWADARLGVYDSSIMNDAKHAKDFVSKSERERREIAGRLGDAAAAHLRRQLAAVPDGCHLALVATHVPPFQGSHPTGDAWLAQMVCVAAGEAILEAAQAAPSREFVVLCGHTHRPDEFKPRPNLRVNVGHAQRDQPENVAIVEI